MKRVDLEKEVRQIQWPELDPAFRGRVLAAVPSVEHRISWSDRWWFSRTWRLSAAVAMVVLVALESLSNSTAPPRMPTWQEKAEAQAIEEERHQLGLPAGIADVLESRALAAPLSQGRSDLQVQTALRMLDLEGDRQ